MASQNFTDNYLLYLLAQASAEASAQFHGELKKQGIPVLNWRILASLFPERRLTIGQLAHHALANQTTLTRAVDRMELAGLVSRSPSEGDRRQVYVCLTPDGAKLGSKLTLMAKQHEAGILQNCSTEDVNTLKEMLAMLRRNI